jgi:hypothetical protein
MIVLGFARGLSMRAAQPMIRTASAIAALLCLPFTASSQVSQKNLFALHIAKIKRGNEGCTVVAESATVRFQISSDLPANCGMLRAGETYKAVRATIQNDPKNENKDAVILIVYDNVENVRRDNSIFSIDSEEAIQRK